MDERGEEIAVANEGDRERGARTKEPVKENISASEVVMGLPGGGSVVAPVDKVGEGMGGAGPLGGDPVEGILCRRAEGEGPGIVMGISGGDGTVREGKANTAANGEAEVDTWWEVGVGGADREAGKDVEGEVGDTKGASTANRGKVDGGREGVSRGVFEGAPLLLPFNEVAVLSEPR